MTTTTGLDLLAHADHLTRQLRRTTEPVTAEQWNTFDATVHRLLLEIAGLNAFHVRPGDPSHTAMHLALRNYPQPLRAPVGTSLSPEQAAPFLGVGGSTVRKYAKTGQLRARVEDGQFHINALDIPGQVEIHPADPGDPHPLPKVSCALGALADLLHQARHDAAPILDHRGEIAGATIHVLSLAAVAARHTLAHGPLDEVARPVLVARYAEQTIDALRDVAHRPASLHEVTAVSGDAKTGTPVERLEVALHHWVRATGRELDQMVPSIDVMRQIANQGAHLCAVTAGLVTHTDMAGAEPTLPDKSDLLAIGASLKRGERAWGRLTTLTRASHDFVTTSRDLFEALHAVGSLGVGDPEVDRYRIAVALHRGLAEISALVAKTRGLPETLLNAGVLLSPATAIEPSEARVTQRLRREHVHVDYTDVPELVRRWSEACASVQSVSRRVTMNSPFLQAPSRSPSHARVVLDPPTF